LEKALRLLGNPLSTFAGRENVYGKLCLVGKKNGKGLPRYIDGSFARMGIEAEVASIRRLSSIRN